MDERIRKLAELLTDYSCNVQPGDNVLIEYEGERCHDLVRQLIKTVYDRGGVPFCIIQDNRILRELLKGSNEEQLAFNDEIELARAKHMQADIYIAAPDNPAELADVEAEKINMYYKSIETSTNYRINNTKWCVLGYPTPAMAQMANTSMEEFENFFFDVCTVDYAKMSRAMDPLVDLMNKTDQVRIQGPGTELTFSIKGIGAVKCDGLRNIPDGEVYTAPVRDSLNGIISYNTPSEEQGFTYDNIVFEIKNGKIIDAKANDTNRINDLLDVDEGARYFGEFALGVNPYIIHPIKNTLFDEKISGSFHLTPGMSYEDAFNGNKSANHWDLVMIQTPEYGGGKIWFDDVLVRDDGVFVLPELEGLNPENLK